MNSRLSFFWLAFLPAAVLCQLRVTPPESFFGHPLGADYHLINYEQYVAYLKKLDAESSRLQLVIVGKTAEGRDQFMAVVTSPENARRLDRFREISGRLSRAKDADEKAARELAREGKSVVWIDGGLHATEVLCAQALAEMAYVLVQRDDPETRRILDDCIILLVHANPDGHDLVANWYMRKSPPETRSAGGVPRLYQKYIGHDNNRDFYASTQPETRNMNRVLYHEWYPQIVYNHHQTGPAGTVMFAPPFRDPFPYECDPLCRVTLDAVSAAMHQRFIAENKPGVTMRSGASYSAWWNGGLRTTTYYHNMVGILTETIGSPNPIQVPFRRERQLPSMDLPFPIEPQTWRLRQSVEYSITANYAILDYASRYRESLLLNVWRMGRNSIEKGLSDTWTPHPRRIAAANSLQEIRRPEDRDAKLYLIPSDQPDFGTAVKFVNMLIDTGIEIERTRQAVQIDGRLVPAGSYLVRLAQAYRPHILSMFEPQVHPDDFAYQGGPPTPPYDSAGWTPAFTFGIDFLRVLDPPRFDATAISGRAAKPTGMVSSPRGLPAGYVLDPRVNDSFVAVNRLLRDGVSVFRVSGSEAQGEVPVLGGSFYVPEAEGLRPKIAKIANEVGVRFRGVAGRPRGTHVPVSRNRIALWDRYGGSMTSGWTRWILEQFEFDFDVAFPPEIDAGALAKYDVLILPDGATFGSSGGGGPQARTPDDPTIPLEWKGRMGNLTLGESLPQVRQFLEAGGTVVAIGSATGIAQRLGLPVESALVDRSGPSPRPLGRDKFFVPGSVLRVRVEDSEPECYGLPATVDVMFDNSPAFAIRADADLSMIRKLAWFDSETPLRSGWAWGQGQLKDAIAALSISVGKGRLLLLGPEVLFRGQTHGSFKFVFNSLFSPKAPQGSK